MRAAGRLKMPRATVPSAICTISSGEAASRGGHGDAQVREKADEVPRPSHGHRRRAERVLEDQVPPDDPGESSPDRGVGVGVGAPGDGDHGRQLRVAQPRQRAGDRRDEHGERRAPVPRAATPPSP